MKKRLLSMALALCMCLSFFPITVFATEGQTTEATITFAVIGGKWSDGSTENKTVKVDLNSYNNKGTLPIEQIPTGMKPNKDYWCGMWESYPNTNEYGITKSDIYTYRFVPVPSGYKPDSPRKTIISGTSALRNPKERQDWWDAEIVKISHLPSDYIWFGQNNGTDPIKWRILDTEYIDPEHKKSLFVLSEYILESGIYFKKDNASHRGWVNSDAEAWCKGFTVNDAFNSAECDTVQYFVKKNDNGNAQCGEYGFTAQGAYFLSREEIKKYIGEGGWVAATPSGTTKTWWLRSTLPSPVDFNVWFVTNVGEYESTLPNVSHSARPACNLEPNDILFISAANDGKQSNLGLTAISNWDGNEWKLTVKDKSRKDFSASVTSTGKVFYSNAKTGSNEYLSVIIKDTTGAYTHYGKILKLDGTTNGASGTAQINNFADIDLNGKTLYVFNEQCNGAKKTDYASELCNASAAAVTFKVVNGTWHDNTSEDKTIPVSLTNGTGNLSNEQIPTNMIKKDATFDDGKWDTTPNTTDSITGDVTYTYTFNEKPLDSIKITKAPTRTEYTEGESFDKAGMKVQANYSDGTSAEITEYTVTDGNNLTIGQTSVTISYNGKQATQSITVNTCNHANPTHVEAKDATCTEDGCKEHYKCSSCGKTFADAKCQTGIDAIIPAGHDWGSPIITLSPDGKTATALVTCQRDGNHTQSLACNVSSEVKTPATCNTKGTTTYTATVLFEGKNYTATKDVQDIPEIGSGNRPDIRPTPNPTPSTPSTNLDSSDNEKKEDIRTEIKIEVSDKDFAKGSGNVEVKNIDKVPSDLKNQFTSVKDMLDKTMNAIREYIRDVFDNAKDDIKDSIPDKIKFEEKNTMFFDAKMKSGSDGKIILPMPKGVDPKSNKFLIAHIMHNGKIEVVEGKVTENGIEVTLNGLSPVMITWFASDLAAGEGMVEVEETI